MNTPKDTPNIDINPHDWAEVERILNTFASAYEVWAFGSRVRRTAKPYSDLDLAIITSQPLSISDYATLVDEFDSSVLPFKVDIVDWASTSTAFQSIIRERKITLKRAYGSGR